MHKLRCVVMPHKQFERRSAAGYICKKLHSVSLFKINFKNKKGGDNPLLLQNTGFIYRQVF